MDSELEELLDTIDSRLDNAEARIRNAHQRLTIVAGATLLIGVAAVFQAKVVAQMMRSLAAVGQAQMLNAQVGMARKVEPIIDETRIKEPSPASKPFDTGPRETPQAVREALAQDAPIGDLASEPFEP